MASKNLCESNMGNLISFGHFYGWWLVTGCLSINVEEGMNE